MRYITSTEREAVHLATMIAERDRLAKQSRDTPGALFRKRPIQYRELEKIKGPLELLNERLSAEGDRQLHATKGYRRLTTKRTLAAVITARMKAGETGWSTQRISQVLKGELFL